jgi:hypothetical protein
VDGGVWKRLISELITGINEIENKNIKIYPNPATDFVKLKIENYETDNLKYQLYDINGSLLLDNKVESNETSIIMSNYLPSTYFLKISDKNKVVKTFKIIKH